MRRLQEARPISADELRASFAFLDSDDYREGLAAFLEKRAPNYPNQVSTDMPEFFPWWDEPGFE